jgi:hypothetical protein
MGRLKHPETETVVSVEGDLEAQYKASGWVDADEAPEADKPAPARKRTSK